MTRAANSILAASVPFVALSVLSAVLTVGFSAGCTFAFPVISLMGHSRDMVISSEILHSNAEMFLQSQEPYISSVLAF